MAVRKPVFKYEVLENNFFQEKPIVKNTPVDNFIIAINKQIKQVEADIAEKEAEEPVRRWYKVKDNIAGVVIRYGTKPVFLLPSQTNENPGFKAGSNLQDVKKFLEELLKCTNDHQFDAIIEKTAQDMTEERAKSRLENKLKKAEKEEETHSTPDSVL